MENKLFRYNTEIKIVQSSIKKINPQFSLCDVLVCYHGDNRNMISLPKKVIEENLYSIYGIPIVGEWIYKLDGTEEKTWGSHGGRIILDSQGIHFEATTKPFGFVSKEAADNASWVIITEKDGHTQKEYLKLSGCILWTERYEESKSILDDNYGQSMEIQFQKGHYREDNYYETEKFIFSALCILGTDCEPCFESACIGRHYELDSFKKEFSLMLDEYKKFNNKPNKEGKKFMGFTKFTDILSTLKIEGKEKCKYTLLSITDSQVFALDMENYKPYAFNYAITNNENIGELIIDFDSKVEMSLSATEKIMADGFTEFNIQSEITAAVNENITCQVNEATKVVELEFNKKVEELRIAYEDLSNCYSVALNKVEKYEEKENAEKAEKHKDNISEIFTKYSEKLGKCAEFLIYKAKVKPEEVTLDEVSEKLTLMAGKFMMDSKTKQSFSYQPQETNINKSHNDEITNRYGHLLDKYKGI